MDMKKNPFSLHVNVDDFIPATDAEKEYMVQMRPSTTFFKDGMKRLVKNKIAFISMILIIVITLAAIILPMFWPYKYDAMLGVRPGRPVDKSYNNLAPFEYGKTELKKMEAGEKVFPIVLIIGVTIGSIAGYCGGKVDIFIMRIVDIIYSLPDTLMVILLATVMKQTLGAVIDGTVLAKLGSNIISLFVVFALLYWVSMSRLIRGQILSLREQEPLRPPAPRPAGSSASICCPTASAWSLSPPLCRSPAPSSPRATCPSWAWVSTPPCLPWAAWPPTL